LKILRNKLPFKSDHESLVPIGVDVTHKSINDQNPSDCGRSD